MWATSARNEGVLGRHYSQICHGENVLLSLIQALCEPAVPKIAVHRRFFIQDEVFAGYGHYAVFKG